MKGFLLTLGVAVGLFGFTDTASAQHWHHGHHHHGHHHGGFHPGHGWGGGHVHFIPAHTHFHPDPWGGHVHFHPGRVVIPSGPAFFPAPRSPWGFPGPGFGGFGNPHFRSGTSFGLTIIR